MPSKLPNLHAASNDNWSLRSVTLRKRARFPDGKNAGTEA